MHRHTVEKAAKRLFSTRLQTVEGQRSVKITHNQRFLHDRPDRLSD
ncbi:hypothetical protein [Thalassoglobus neptunius]|nr:hypothetical protein [Thalassoglobus neptunius]